MTDGGREGSGARRSAGGSVLGHGANNSSTSAAVHRSTRPAPKLCAPPATMHDLDGLPVGGPQGRGDAAVVPGGAEGKRGWVATCCEQRAVTYAAMLTVACILHWL